MYIVTFPVTNEDVGGVGLTDFRFKAVSKPYYSNTTDLSSYHLLPKAYVLDLLVSWLALLLIPACLIPVLFF